MDFRGHIKPLIGEADWPMWKDYSKTVQEALIATKSERPRQEGKYKLKSRKEDTCNYCKLKGHWREVIKELEHMLAHIRTKDYSEKEFLSDNGGEFDNKDVRAVLHSNGIVKRLTVPYTPGGSEREMQTISEMARAFKYANPEVSFRAAI
ncbi:retrovirus-related pol polyprotein from transposon tnt 1-94 [Nephila pilipes]|uniref:Retrovirus-related pol polyprotein from transposon tnt 1-94 n=1 Tax=Nephila pilipes TaxID=299642 RepID=A0A8X6QUY7_NEPPI|nr:retrovirus-related pol polyprotein from transposon tnt 1-94 [Nephila pilipes]